MTLFYIAIGGALGAVLRFLVSNALTFPFGTLAVNVAGSFIMGLAFIFFADKGMERAAPLVMVGALGAFTTFSTFSLDVLRLFEDGRAGYAMMYIAASVVLSLAAIFVAVMIARGAGL